jgi:hypothetical protein
MFIFKAMDINHQSCPPFYKLSNYPNKIVGLHFTICIKNICWLNYVFVIMQHLMVLRMELMAFLKYQIGTSIREKYSHYYDNNIESKWTPIEPIITYI